MSKEMLCLNIEKDKPYTIQEGSNLFLKVCSFDNTSYLPIKDLKEDNTVVFSGIFIDAIKAANPDVTLSLFIEDKTPETIYSMSQPFFNRVVCVDDNVQLAYIVVKNTSKKEVHRIKAPIDVKGSIRFVEISSTFAELADRLGNNMEISVEVVRK